MVKAFPNGILLFLDIIALIFDFASIRIQYSPKVVHLRSCVILALLETVLDGPDSLACGLHLMFAVYSMDGAFWADGSIAVEAKVGKLLLRVSLAHIEWLI